MLKGMEHLCLEVQAGSYTRLYTPIWEIGSDLRLYTRCIRLSPLLKLSQTVDDLDAQVIDLANPLGGPVWAVVGAPHIRPRSPLLGTLYSANIITLKEF